MGLGIGTGSLIPLDTWGSGRTHRVLASVGAVRTGFVLRVSFAPISGPVDAVTRGLATAAEHREWPEHPINSEDLFPVALASDIVDTLPFDSFLLKVLNGGRVAESQRNVELEEHSHQNSDDGVKHVGDLDQYVPVQQLLVKLVHAFVGLADINAPLD